MKILIVEDDLALSDVVSFTLRRAGFEILTAYDGLAALASWEANRPGLLALFSAALVLNRRTSPSFTARKKLRTSKRFSRSHCGSSKSLRPASRTRSSSCAPSSLFRL